MFINFYFNASEFTQKKPPKNQFFLISTMITLKLQKIIQSSSIAMGFAMFSFAHDDHYVICMFYMYIIIIVLIYLIMFSGLYSSVHICKSVYLSVPITKFLMKTTMGKLLGTFDVFALISILDTILSVTKFHHWFHHSEHRLNFIVYCFVVCEISSSLFSKSLSTNKMLRKAV